MAGILAGLAAVLTLPTAAPRAVAGEPGTTPFVQVRVDQVTPDVVTTTSEPVVTVTGIVTNVGDRPVRDVMVRLERAAAVGSSAGLRTNLDGGTDQYEPVGDFLTVASELQRGQNAGFTLSAPVRSLTDPSLAIDKPGVYPLLVNVNGTPDYGEPARLDNARFLLPVMGVPADPADKSSDALSSVVAPDTSKPVQVTMLWPLADRPRLSPGVPGGTIPVRLVDDELATSLATGGRLDILLSAAEFATSRDVDPDGAVGRSLCLAVDPDLLVTANAMTRGYVVSDAPDNTGPGAPVHPGTGQAAAVSWLDRLRALAHRMCVAPTPYAQADLDAVQRVGDTGLRDAAGTATAGDIVDQILGVASIRGATLIADGLLTRRSVDLLGALNGAGGTVAVAAAQFSGQDSATGEPATADIAPRRVSAQVVAAPFDPTVGAALAAAGTDPVAPTYLDASLAVRLRHDSATARRQDALGSMLWRGLQPDVAQRTEVLVPPATWTLQSDDAGAILTTLAAAVRSGLAVPRPLPALIADASAVNAAPRPVGDDIAPRGRFDDVVIAQIAGELARLGGLTAALTTDVRTGLTGAGYTAPLREDMLRAVSQSERPDSRNGLAHRRVQIVGDTIDDLYGSVTIVNPGGSYTLATEHSPLPLALHNGLAVPIRVRLHVDTPPGMSVTDLGEMELPPGYLPLRVPIEVNFTQRVAIDVSLRTPDGVPLGEPVRLSVHSNAYGKVLFAITLSAAAVLVTLAGRRLWHRFRGQPDRADLDRPEPGEVEQQARAVDRVEEEHPV
ncbi:hypothetical protein [Mycobacterium celatum]|nr:hypothetical protein [Mycobacterium celatum]PIB73609.1 hypothetical protein CQY23_22860 [Mycobacterium celatum]